MPTDVLQEILRGVREHLTEPVRLFAGVAEVLSKVAQTHRVVLITKGDLVHQTRKVETSGLAHLFNHVEIVLEKDLATYRRVLSSLNIDRVHEEHRISLACIDGATENVKANKILGWNSKSIDNRTTQCAFRMFKGKSKFVES